MASRRRVSARGDDVDDNDDDEYGSPRSGVPRCVLPCVSQARVVGLKSEHPITEPTAITTGKRHDRGLICFIVTHALSFQTKI